MSGGLGRVFFHPPPPTHNPASLLEISSFCHFLRLPAFARSIIVLGSDVDNEERRGRVQESIVILRGDDGDARSDVRGGGTETREKVRDTPISF